MTKKSFGCVGVINKSNILVGIITDGDLRRNMNQNIILKKASQVMTRKPTVVDEIIEDDNSIYLRIDKRSKIEDVVKELRTIIKPTPSFTSKFGIQKQHKYIPTHVKYNVFVWRQEGHTRTEILDMLNKSYKYYDTRIPKDESSVRR